MVVPDCAESIGVYFWHYMLSEDSTTDAYDFLYLWVYDITTDTVVFSSSINNTTFPRGGWMPLFGPVASDATGLRGHRLGFLVNGVTDGVLPTIWYVDNVQLIVDCAPCP